VADHLFSFRVLSPLGTAFEGMAKSATLPTPDGEITILAHHMPIVAVLTDGEVRIDTGKKVVFVAVAGGFLETGKAAAHVPGTTAAAPGGTAATAATAATVPGGIRVPGGISTWEATVLSDFAAEADSIEVARVEAARARAEQLLSEKKERGEILLVERDLHRSILQWKVAEKNRKRRHL
jgi:F-type H+-transporting ATPase subunit epsilon